MLNKIAQKALGKREPGLLEKVAQQTFEKRGAEPIKMFSKEHKELVDQWEISQRHGHTISQQTTTPLQRVGGFLGAKISRVADPIATALTGKTPRERGFTVKTPEGDIIREPALGPSKELRLPFARVPSLEVAPGSPLSLNVAAVNFFGRIAEIIPKGAAVGATEVSHHAISAIVSRDFDEYLNQVTDKNATIRLPIDARRLGFQQKEMTTAAGEMMSMMDAGYTPLESSLMVTGSRVLDVAIGASMTRSVAKITTDQLAKAGGSVQKVDAYTRLGFPKDAKELRTNYRRFASEYHPDNPLGSDAMFIRLAKDNATLLKGGFSAPTRADFARYQAWRLSEPFSRETVIAEIMKSCPIVRIPAKEAVKVDLPGFRVVETTPAYWKFQIKTNEWNKIWQQAKTFPERFARPELGAKIPEQFATLTPSLRLPGYQPTPGQPRPMGLSIQEWQRVGGEKAKIATELTKKVGTEKANQIIASQGEKLVQDVATMGMAKAIQAVQAVPEGIEPLIQEARKYKSAEEFVESMLFHGTSETRSGKIFSGEGLIGSKGRVQASKGRGIRYVSATPEAEAALGYASGRGERAVLVGVPKPKNIVNLGDIRVNGNLTSEGQDFVRRFGRQELDWGGKEVESFLKQNNYDAIQFMAPDGHIEVRIFGDVKNPIRLPDGFVKVEKATFMGKPTEHFSIDKSQLTDIYNQAVGKTPRVEITPTIPKGTPLSTHFERIKPQLDDLATGIGFEKINLEQQAKRAFRLIEQSPNKALRVAYGIDQPPEGLFPESVQISLIESLKSAGRKEEAIALGRRLSLSLTDSGQKLNLAKLDLGSAGERKIEGTIKDVKLTKIGEGIPKGIRELEPKQRAINKIKADASQAIKDSFEATKLGEAEGLLADMKLTGELRSELAKGFSKDNITIQKLYDMSSGQRRDVLEKYIGKERGKELSGSFERALLSNQKQALRDWVWKNVYEGKGLYKEIELEQAKRMFDSGIRARDLRKLTSEERISKLSKYVGRRNAELLDERFLKAQKGGTLANWEQRVMGSKDLHTHEKANRILTRLQSIDEMGVLTPDQAKNFMEDFLYIKLGVDVTEVQAKEISRMVKRITDSSNKIGDNWTYTNKENIKEYFKGRREMEDFMKKINPDSAIDVFTSVGARGSILAALRIPVNSLMFQIVPGISRTISKRIVTPLLLPGDYKFLDRMHVMLSGLKHPIANTEFWREQTKMGISIYKETGYDISRMQTLEDGFRYFGEKYTNPVGPTWGESKGIAEKMGATVRGHARLVQPALKYGAGGTDAVFASSHRAGTTQLLARQAAQLEEMMGLLPNITERDLVFLPNAKVGEIMTVAQREEMLIKESLSFNPQSVQGQYIREMGILDAHHANFTTNDGYGKLAIKLRNILPKGLGQTIAPFAKIPANALGKGFEATGPGIIMGLQRYVKALEMPLGAERNIEMAEGLTQALMAGGILGTTIVLTSMLDNDDFIGAYDYRARSENNLTTTKNAGANYIRIGGNWYNLRWTGPFALPISAAMTARKNKAEGKSTVIGYGTGVITGLLEFPVIKELYGLGSSIKKASTSDSFSSFLNNAGMDMESVRRWISVRTIPAIISHDVQGLFDETRYDSFGRPIPEKSFKNFIVGANIKEDTSNVITKEFDRLNSRGYMPVLTDPTGDHIEFLKFFSEVMDDRYYVELLAEKKRDYSFGVFELMQSEKYKEMSNEEIKTAIDAIRRKEILDPLRDHAKELQKELNMEGITSEEIAWEKVAHKYGRTVSEYARAFSTDPYNAFRALLTKEELGRIEGNLVELQRFYGIKFDEPGGSQDYKKALMNQHGIPWEERENYKLEHIIPVSAGGGNEDANLMLVDTATWQFFTPIDIAVGNAVKDKRITRKQAKEIMIDFKVNRKITAEEVMEKIR